MGLIDAQVRSEEIEEVAMEVGVVLPVESPKGPAGTGVQVNWGWELG